MVQRVNVHIDQTDPLAANRLYHALRFEKSVNLISLPKNLTDADECTDFLYEQGVEIVFAPAGAEALQQRLKGRTYRPTILPRFKGTVASSGPMKAGELLVDCYTDQGGNLRYHFLQELREVAGKVRALPTDQTVLGIEKLASQLNRHHALRGGWYFLANQKPDGIFEVSGGAATGLDGASLSRLRGVNFPALMLFEAMGRDIDFLIDESLDCFADWDARGLCATAAPDFDEVFFDLDDTLIVHGQVNLDALDFLTRCRANKKPVTLVTRHYREPGITLAEHNIDPELFAQVLWLTNGNSKAEYIPQGTLAIFIDDAYKERKDVAMRSSCRVFAPDALPALLGGVMKESAP